MGSNPEFAQYIDQFTENVYNRTKIPILTHKSFVSENLFNSYHYEAHNIAWQLLIHFSVHLKAPIRVESNGLDLERTYTVNTTVYILNWLFRIHQDIIDVSWIEL
ncbi:unnamed protein product [Rhizophagus irregularis]|uniref:Uncharacterized protein n=1 Tax=Rhizophagus irregularis TaxID=588596 RepID=A0A915ZSL2_9GLOM|nr:unnamed protein product [Rhizophagus irregularis]CAB5386638.1 unnamed protein product [Rhizophagus irregularis]